MISIKNAFYTWLVSLWLVSWPRLMQKYYYHLSIISPIEKPGGQKFWTVVWMEWDFSKKIIKWDKNKSESPRKSWVHLYFLQLRKIHVLIFPA